MISSDSVLKCNAPRVEIVVNGDYRLSPRPWAEHLAPFLLIFARQLLLQLRQIGVCATIAF